MTRRQKERLAPPLHAFYRMPFLHRIKDDPVTFLHRYTDPKEIETVGFLTASFAYGRVELFNKVIEKILLLSENSFYRYLLMFDLKKERPRFRNIYYRFNPSKDILAFLYIMSEVIKRYGTIQTLFLSCYCHQDSDIGPTLSRFIAKIKKIDTRPIYGQREKPRSLLYLFPSPEERKSACKRLNLYLRWMVRPNDGIDFGFWKEVSPSQLIIPLDTHIARIGGYLGLTSRRTADWVMAKEITENLKQFDPVDPLKYDFPLCHLGISGNCPVEQNDKKCQVCPLLPACKRGTVLVGCKGTGRACSLHPSDK